MIKFNETILTPVKKTYIDSMVNRFSSHIEPKDKIKKTIVDKLLATGYKGKIKIVELPENKDPDDLIRDGEIDLLASCIMDGKYHKKMLDSQRKACNINCRPSLMFYAEMLYKYEFKYCPYCGKEIKVLKD